LGLQGWKPDHAWSAMAEGLISDSLRILLSQKTHPILVTSTYSASSLRGCVLMSRSGIHEVGILVGILRKLQHWSFSSIVFEYRSFAGPNARFTEEQFIEVFDEKAIVLPSNLPTWWIQQEELVHADDTETEHPVNDDL
jgi:protein tyrosine/serine phosphatase